MPNIQPLKVEIPKPNIQIMEVEIKGTTPIIYHRWTEKAKLMLLKTQQKDPEAKKRAIRDPKAEYLDSFYRDSDGDIAWPVLNIKKAMTDSARNIPGVTMTLLRGSVFTVGDQEGFVKMLIDGKTIQTSEDIEILEQEKNGIYGVDKNNANIKMRQDLVRVGMGSADLRYRGQLSNWTIKFLIKWNNDVVSAGQVLNLLNTAGFACGLGEWRPSCDGVNGTFEVATEAE